MRNSGYKRLILASSVMMLGILCLAPESLAADEFSVSTSVDSTLAPLDGTISYTITVEGDSQDIKLSIPPWKGFTQVGQPRVSRSSSGSFFSFQMQTIVNGKVVTSKNSQSGSQTTEYVYTLKAVSPGRHVLGSVIAKKGGKEARSEPIDVRILNIRAKEMPVRKDFSNVQGDIYIDAWVDRSEIYKGEQVTYVLTLFYARDIDSRGIEYVNKPEFPGFLVEETPTRDPYRLRYETKEYRAYEITRYSLTPVREGELAIKPVKLSVNVIVGRDFLNYRTKKYQVTSDSLKVNVIPLPTQGRPKGFKGAVGSFEMEASISPDSVKVGEPVTIRIDIFGEGSIDSMGLPSLASTKGFSEYEPESSVSKTSVGGNLFGERHVEMLLSPMSVESNRIPEVRFSYFDLAGKKYRTLKAGPFDIAVTPAPLEGPKVFSNMNVAGSGKQEIIVKNILANYKGPLGEQKGPAQPLGGGLIAAMLLGPAVLYLITALTMARRTRYATDVAYARSKAARKAAHRRLADARRTLETNEGEFCPHLAKALTTFLADRLNVPAGGLTVGDCRDALEERDITSETVAELSSILEACDMGSFAGRGHDGAEKKHLLDRAETCIERLEASLKR